MEVDVPEADGRDVRENVIGGSRLTGGASSLDDLMQLHVLYAITALVNKVSVPEINTFSSPRRPRSARIGPVSMTHRTP
jgi:hypothetical protein